MPSSSFIEYKEAIGILENTSQHVLQVPKAIREKILPKLSQRNSVLDVGAGNGKIARTLLQDFANVSAVEVNPELKSFYEDSGITLYNTDFMEVDFCNKKFDLVICSHVMYHLNKSDMTSFINKLLSLVNPDGYCLIVLMAPRGQNHIFHQQFNAEYVNSKNILDILDEKKINYERFEAHNYFTTDDKYKMQNLLKFFWVEDCQNKKSSALGSEEIKQAELILEQQLKQCEVEDGYKLDQKEDYFLIPGIKKR